MVNIEIDGKRVEVESGSTVIQAAHQLGIYVPHFCYHKKLSIAANCRMCLVQVEKAPKPLPACATPATEGMKVFTASEQAIKAQKGVMEFLLINHPLDCPICDQGGECQLQDLAVGYGGSASRYKEEKRAVLHKDIGPLVSAEEMSRCINCTRCVRFGVEIGGVMELGQAFRGEHAEIMTFVSGTVDSELSGNMIDLCPVGALTSKPFRYTARTWELSRRKSISPHDSLGSNLVVQVKNNRVMRVLPLENEDVNECWLSDKDRFSYEGLNSNQRLTKPMIKQGGKWQEVEWQVALEYAANGLRQIIDGAGAEHIGAMATPHSTVEELYLLQKLVRGMGSHNVDFRLRQSDFSADGKQGGASWLGMPLAEINTRDRFLIIGSFLRKDHPLLAARVRQAVKKGAQANVLHAADDELLMPVANKAIVAPAEMTAQLAQVLKALATVKQAALDASVQQAVQSVAPSAAAQAMANSLASGERVAVLLGNFAQQHPQAAQLQLLAQHIAALCGGKFGFIGEAANSVGGYLAQAVPFEEHHLPPKVGNPLSAKADVELSPPQGEDAVASSPASGRGERSEGPRRGLADEHGMNAAAMLAAPRKAYLLLNVEAELDTANPQQAMNAMQAADMVVALSAFKHHATEYADVMLPIAPFTETSGTFINTEGRVQSFKGAVKPLGEARPAWKVLRVLGNLLNIAGFEHESSEAVRDEALQGVNVAGKLNNHIAGVALQQIPPAPLLPAEGSLRSSGVSTGVPLAGARGEHPAVPTLEKGAANEVSGGFQRVADVPIYFSDAIVRRSAPLQTTRDAMQPSAYMHSAALSKLGVKSGEIIRVSQGQGSARLTIVADDKLPQGVVRVAAGHAATSALGAMFGTVTVERE